jgi:hypothetical protein
MKFHRFAAACFAIFVACSANSSTTVQKRARIFDCSNPNAYRLVVEDDLSIVVGDDVVSKIKLPREGEFKNFSLNSVEKKKAGFEIKVDWGSGIDHYEVEFNFRCRRNSFYLYRVKKVSYSTKNRDSGSFLDQRRIKVTRPNLPIDKFVMTKYL